jgi:hypothetical protein
LGGNGATDQRPRAAVQHWITRRLPGRIFGTDSTAATAASTSRARKLIVEQMADHSVESGGESRNHHCGGP